MRIGKKARPEVCCAKEGKDYRQMLWHAHLDKERGELACTDGKVMAVHMVDVDPLADTTGPVSAAALQHARKLAVGEHAILYPTGNVEYLPDGTQFRRPAPTNFIGDMKYPDYRRLYEKTLALINEGHAHPVTAFNPALMMRLCKSFTPGRAVNLYATGGPGDMFLFLTADKKELAVLAPMWTDETRAADTAYQGRLAEIAAAQLPGTPETSAAPPRTGDDDGGAEECRLP